MPYIQLNAGWNAEPNAPDPQLAIDGDAVLLTFRLNPYQVPQFREGQQATIRFESCSRYRLGAPNDHGWYSEEYGRAGAPPEWGEFYEVDAEVPHRTPPVDWMPGPAAGASAPQRHFLFYLRDSTFECEATNWHLETQSPGPDV